MLRPHLIGMLDRDTVGRSHFGGFDHDEGSDDEDGQVISSIIGKIKLTKLCVSLSERSQKPKSWLRS